MRRRDFLRCMGMAGLGVLWPWPMRTGRAQVAGYDGPLFISIAAMGGWDVTSFCDPKTNVGGQPVINHWAQGGDVRSISGSPIRYAPFANNTLFFPRFHGDMLVVNGIDAQTNSHDAGVRHNWSGRIAAGYPSFAAMVAAIRGSTLPLAFITNGAYRETAGLVPYTQLDSPSTLSKLASPNEVPWGGTVYNDDDEIAIIERYQDERLSALLGQSDLLPKTERGLANLAAARASREQIAALRSHLPEEFPDPIDRDGNYNYLLQQIDLALVCYDAGLTVSCDLVAWGFDTHGDHDTEQAGVLAQLTNGVEYLWDSAEAMGIADRLVVFISSDFGRSPYYNDGAGKDHWPIGSAILMQRNAAWTNRVVGETDTGHNALPLDPQTLRPDPEDGIVLQPKHLQATLRRLAGIESHAYSQRFPLDVAGVDLLDPRLPG